MNRSAIIALALLAALAPPAHATFPGSNGKLAVSVDTCEFNPHLRAVSPGGKHLGYLTKPCEMLGIDEDEEQILRSARAPEWSPDGRRLMYTQPSGLDTIGASGGEARTLAGTAKAEQPSYSPDGNRVAFMRDGAIWTMAADGRRQRLLRAKPTCPRDEDNCVHLDEPRWSPDGRLIAVRADQFAYGPGRRALPRPGLWLIDARTGRYVRRIVRGDKVGRAPFEPDWSPDGKRLVYRTSFQQDEMKGGASGGNIWVVDRSGRNNRRLVHRKGMAEASPVWSPDGKQVAWIGLGFTSGDVAFDVRATIMRVRVKDGRRQVVRRLPSPYVEEAYYHLPELSWQPLLMRR